MSAADLAGFCLALAVAIVFGWFVVFDPTPPPGELERAQWAACVTTCAPGLVAVANFDECRCHAAAPCTGGR